MDYRCIPLQPASTSHRGQLGRVASHREQCRMVFYLGTAKVFMEASAAGSDLFVRLPPGDREIFT